jgi:PAS domain S-box-containing protein
VLREREERLKTILDSLQAGIVCINAETYTIVDANLAAIEMIGAAKEQIIGHVCHKYICP